MEYCLAWLDNIMRSGWENRDILLIPGRKVLSQQVFELSIVVIVIDTLKSIWFLSVIESNSYVN